jgi:predicted RNA-binding protein YlqC (UPF0109 family)
MSYLSIPNLITDMCTAIVGHNFRLGAYEGSDTLLLEIFAVAPHIGRLIGHEGQVVHAMRDIAVQAGWREGLWVYLDVWEE